MRRREIKRKCRIFITPFATAHGTNHSRCGSLRGNACRNINQRLAAVSTARLFTTGRRLPPILTGNAEQYIDNLGRLLLRRAKRHVREHID